MNKDTLQLTGKLNTIGDNFVLTLNNLKEIDYVTAMQSTDSTSANVKMIISKLNREDNTVGLLLNDPSLYNDLNVTTTNVASLLEDLESHPEHYVHFSLFGKKDKQGLRLYRFCLNSRACLSKKEKPLISPCTK